MADAKLQNGGISIHGSRWEINKGRDDVTWYGTRFDKVLKKVELAVGH